MGIHRGPDDPYTKEMLSYWFMEPNLFKKLFDDIVPRLRDTPEPYTYLIRLPTERLRRYKDARIEHWGLYRIGVLEINGLFLIILLL
jgi:hypothetical protein